MKRIFSNPFAAIAAGLCLRLFFVLKFPANSGDAVLYEQMATNWLKHGVYAMDVFGKITPVDLRMPGYPAFLAIVYALTGRTGIGARTWVTLAQIPVDLLTCWCTACLASVLLAVADENAPQRRVFMGGLWLSALCPFTANYTAAPLTEVFATFFTTAAAIPLVLLVTQAGNGSSVVLEGDWPRANRFWSLAAGGALLTGVGTLFRPESPLLLAVAWLVLGFVLLQRHEGARWVRAVAGMGLVCAIPLAPWAIRNAVTLHEVQFLAPKNSNLPGELVPYGFMSWEKTWLYRFRDVYLVPWKLNDEAIYINDIPTRAFDTPAERAEVAAILETYNDDLTLTAEEDAVFAGLARERTGRRPLRTYLWLPAARAVTMWFTPRIELLPVSGEVFPLRQSWREDWVDQSVTVGLFLLNIGYVALAMWGAVLLSRRGGTIHQALILLILFIVVRTAFLTTLETPEPRYVLVCFPVLIALAAQVFGSRNRAAGGSFKASS
jgi:hypothetical protein